MPRDGRHQTTMSAVAVTALAAAAGIVATPWFAGPVAESVVLLLAGGALLFVRRAHVVPGDVGLGLAAGAFAFYLAWRVFAGRFEAWLPPRAHDLALAAAATSLAPLATALATKLARRLRAHPAGPTVVACALALSVVALSSSLAVDALRVRAYGSSPGPAVATAVGLVGAIAALFLTVLPWRALRRVAHARAARLDGAGRLAFPRGDDGRAHELLPPGEVLAWPAPRLPDVGDGAYRRDGAPERWTVVAGDRAGYVGRWRRRVATAHAVALFALWALALPMLAR